MQCVESGPAMTALLADHRVSCSSQTPASRSSSSPFSPVLLVTVVSILISLSAIVLISISTVVLCSLVLTGPAVSLVSGGAGLTPVDTRETLGG